MELETDDYRLLFDANPPPMFVSDRETLQILEVNREQELRDALARVTR